MTRQLTYKMKSVKSINQRESVIQTMYDIIKAHGEAPIAIGIKMESEAGVGTTFAITLAV